MPSSDIKKSLNWFASKGWAPFAFQLEAWESYRQGISGLVNAPTGSGKTFSLLVPILLEGLANGSTKQLQSIWITPIRALGKEIEYSAHHGGSAFEVGILHSKRNKGNSRNHRNFWLLHPRVCTCSSPRKVILPISRTWNPSSLTNGTSW